MAEDMSPEQIAELQKKNCIFCKIVAGEIESKKVYEDDNFLAVLDIRPATPGHTLFLPKEHVPILPILQEEKMIAFFETGTKLSHAIQDAMIANRMQLFLASGYAAGQQAPHLIMHIIPRDKGDGLDMLDLKLDKAQPETTALASIFAQATTQALLHRKRQDLVKHVEHIAETPKTQHNAEAKTQHITETPAQKSEMEFEDMNEALETALNMSPDLKRLIIAQPDFVGEYVKKSPKLSKLFEGVNIRALSLMLQRQEAQTSKQAKPKTAQEMSEEELFAFIDGNEGLRTWILEHPDELAQRINENPRLQQFFANINIKDLARKYNERGA